MNDSQFDTFLKAAKGDEPLPRTFTQGVWHRIESASVIPHPSSRTFGKPWLPALGMAASVILGLWLGARTIPEPDDMTTSYAISISPFAQHPEK
jgi:hypothetical protein